MKRLRRVVHRRRSASTGADSVVTLSVPRDELHVLATDLGLPPRMSGTLLKYTNVVKRWKPRTFVLENGVLIYSSLSGDDHDEPDENAPQALPDRDRERKSRKKSKRLRLLRRTSSKEEKERDIKGSINIQNAVVCPDDSDSCRFAIDVGQEVFHCRAENSAMRDEWVDALNCSIQYFRGLVQRAIDRAKQSTSLFNDFSQSPSPNHDSPNGLAPSVRQPESASVSVNHGPSEDSDESILEDDGLKEAEQSRKALIVELRRILADWREIWTTSAVNFDDNRVIVSTLSKTFAESSTAGESHSGSPQIAKGLIDLLTWCLLVLQTNDDVFDRRVKADITRIMAGGLPVFPDSSNRSRLSRNAMDFGLSDDDSESDFVDALSRAASKRSSFVTKQAAIVEVPSSSRASPLARRAVFSETLEEDLTQPVSIKRIATAALSTGDRRPRSHLPPLTAGREGVNVFSLLKDAVGKDLSKITLPVTLNEPLSFVQRLAEDIEYCELLDTAALESDPDRRLMYVATMVISHYSSTQGRVGKPFNPLLGETACLIRPTKGKGTRFISEQVSHHPPISACYAEGSGASWKYYNAIEVKNKFWGKSLEVFPTGLNHIEFPEHGDHYVFEQVTACVHNIVVGRMWLDNYGEMEIVNRTNGGRCVIEFSKTGWMSDAKSFAAIKATVYGANGKPKIKLGGNWTKSVYEEVPGGKRNVLWTVDERPPDDASQSYNMTKWAITLNEELQPAEEKRIPPTDSRRRPDQRALEQGRVDHGSQLKQLLEEGQRKRRREMEEAEQSWEPLWFEKVTDDETGQIDYRFKGTFFQKQKEGDWSRCPDLFSCATDAQA